MLEDKLSQEQRIRLEALSQAHATVMGGRLPVNSNRVLKVAQEYESYISSATVTVGGDEQDATE